MLNPHPPLAAVPAVVLTLAVAAELLALWRWSVEGRRFAVILVRLLVILAPLTYYSGYWGLEFANQTFTVNEDEIARHQLLAQLFLISLVPLVLLSFLRTDEQGAPRRALHVIYLLLLLVSFCLAALTSFQGGNLVFNHGACVAVPLQK